MKKRVVQVVVVGVIFVGIMLGSVLHVGGSSGNVRGVEISMENSDRHSEADIQNAMELAKDSFKENFKGCKLTDLWYDDTYSNGVEAGWMDQYEGVEAIVLKSNFEVGKSGGDGSLNPGETYSDWEWILVKDQAGEWKLETWGY